MTGVYVRRLFDQHAPEFDTALVERLDYRGPELLLDAVRTIAGVPLRLGSVLDLGCGTGLAARRSGRIATGSSASTFRPA